MTVQDAEYTALGKALLEELVVRAGLRQAHEGLQAEPIAIELAFTVRTDRDGRALQISHERIGAPPLELRIDLD